MIDQQLKLQIKTMQGGSRRDPISKQGGSQQRIISPKNAAMTGYAGVNGDEARQGASQNYKHKSISSGRKNHQQQQTQQQQMQAGSQPHMQASITPQLQSTQSMSSLQNKPFNQPGGRVLVSPTNFASVRTNNGAQQNQHNPNSGASSLSYQNNQLESSKGSKRQNHGSIGKMSYGTNSGSIEAVGLVQNNGSADQPPGQLRVVDNSQAILKQLRKSQVSALRQLKKPAGEQQPQPQTNAKMNRQPGSMQAIPNNQTSTYNNFSLSDRLQMKQTGSQDQLLAMQHQQTHHQINSQPTQLESEYASVGRQDQKIRFYKSSGTSSHHPMSRQAAVGTGAGVASNKCSDENSDDFQQVAEEDMGSFILHRNAYLDGDIQTAESQLFKQQPKLGKDPRPNPNTHNAPGSAQQVTNATGSSGIVYQRQYSSQKQLITGSVASQLSQRSGRESSNAPHTPMHVEDILSNGPSSQQHTSESRLRRKTLTSNGHTSQNNNPPAVGNKSGRKSQHNNYESGRKNQPIVGAPSDYQTQVRAMTTLAAPATGFQQPLFSHPLQPGTNQLQHQQQTGHLLIASQSSEQKRRAAKGLQRVETLTSMGVTSKPQYPMFPLEDNKKAMIQFEMNLLARANKQAAASYSLRQQAQDSQQHGTTLLNKATLCDSSNSKQNSSNSAFLRKSLWLLTSMKNKALKDLVQARQVNCQACHYLKAHGVGCFAQVPIQSPQHAQTFIFNQNDSQGNSAAMGLGSSILMKNNSQSTLGNMAQSVVVQLPPEKQQSSTTAIGGSTNLFLGSTMKSPQGAPQVGVLTTSYKKGDALYSRQQQQQQVQKRGSQKRQMAKHSSQTGIIDKTTGGISSSQGINWLGSMGTQQILLVDHIEQDFYRLMTQKTLNTKYLTSQEYYNSKIAADIMYNEQRHIVSVFKEYLIFDDFSEYLKRFYKFKEAQDRLPRVFEFYEHYSKVFPNYVSVPESKYMFKNIERKQKLIDQRHQIFMKNQQAKEALEEGKDPAGIYKHSANMLFGSQFLREVYADDDKSMSKVSIDLKDLKNVSMSGKKPDHWIKPQSDPRRMDFVSPQAKQAKFDKNMKNTATRGDQSVGRHQGELENMLSMLSKFEQSRREGESMSVSISRSYIDGATGLGPNTKPTPQGVALQTDSSRKNLHKAIVNHQKNASQKNADPVKGKNKMGDPFSDGWNFNEPVHDLSMSSWALTSFIKDYDNQPSAVGLDTRSMIETSTVQPFPTEECLSIDDYIVLTGQSKRDVAQNTQTKEKLQKAPTKTTSVKNEVLHSQVSLGGVGSTTSKNSRKQIDNRRNSVLSPKNGEIKGLQSTVSMLTKGQIEQQKQATGGYQLIKTSRVEKDRVKQTPQRDDAKTGTAKKKTTVIGKTGGSSANNNLANSRCRSKLSIGSSQTQAQQTMTKKGVQSSQNKKQIEKMIKDQSIKLQLDKNNRQLISVPKRTGPTTTTNAQHKAGVLGQNLANLASSSNEPFVGQIYNTSSYTQNPKSAKSGAHQNAVLMNSSRNAKNSSASAIKSSSQVGTHGPSEQAYKSSGHIPSSSLHSSSKVLKAGGGYEGEKGINERFIDLNKASDGAPKITKISGSVIKSTDFGKSQSNSGIRLGDQSVKASNGTGGQNNLIGSTTNASSHNSVRVTQHGLGFRKSIDGQAISVGSQQVSPINGGGTTKMAGHVKTVTRTYHNRALNKQDANHDNTQQKTPSKQFVTQSQSNLPQIFKKEQKDGSTKQIRPSQYDLPIKTIFKHESTNGNTYNSVQSQNQNTNGQLYTKKKPSPEASQHQIQFNQQHTSSKSHEPKDRVSKSESAQKLLKEGNLQTANSVIGHNSQHCLMLVNNNGGSHQMMNQAASINSNQNLRMSKQEKLEGNMLIQNNIMAKNSSLLQQQLGSTGKLSNPYSKTGRILNSLGAQKQSVQSLGHMSSNSGTGSHHIKGGRNTKLNVKTTTNTHMVKGNTAASVSSSSSVGSSKISLNSGQYKSDSSQIYLKTLNRGNQVHLQAGIGTKSTMMMRKTPSGSNSSSKTKKLKVSSNNPSGTSSKTNKVKTTAQNVKQVAQNPYPAGASQGQTIFSVTMPRTLQGTIKQGHQPTSSSNRYTTNNH